MTAMIPMKVQDVKKSPIPTFLSSAKVQETHTKTRCKTFHPKAESRLLPVRIRGKFRTLFYPVTWRNARLSLRKMLILNKHRASFS